jgi:hypothetical protein
MDGRTSDDGQLLWKFWRLGEIIRRAPSRDTMTSLGPILLRMLHLSPMDGQHVLVNISTEVLPPSFHLGRVQTEVMGISSNQQPRVQGRSTSFTVSLPRESPVSACRWRAMAGQTFRFDLPDFPWISGVLDQNDRRQGSGSTLPGLQCL